MLQCAAQMGFEGVQLKPSQYGGLSSTEFRAAFGEQSALVCGGLIVYANSDISGWRSQLEPILEFAAEVRAGHVCICGGVARGDVEARQREAAQTLGQIGELAAASGLKISLHNHADSLFETRADLDAMMKYLAPQLCGITLDTAHLAKAGMENIAALIRHFGPRIVNLHLKDIDSAGQFCPLGMGALDLDAALLALGEIEYDQWLIVDEESRDYEIKSAFEISRDFLHKRGFWG